MASLVSSYRLALWSLIGYFLFRSAIDEKCFLFILAMSQVALRLYEKDAKAPAP